MPCLAPMRQCFSPSHSQLTVSAGALWRNSRGKNVIAFSAALFPSVTWPMHPRIPPGNAENQITPSGHFTYLFLLEQGMRISHPWFAYLPVACGETPVSSQGMGNVNGQPYLCTRSHSVVLPGGWQSPSGLCDPVGDLWSGSGWGAVSISCHLLLADEGKGCLGNRWDPDQVSTHS